MLRRVLRHRDSGGPQLSPIGQSFVLSKGDGIKILQEGLKIGNASHTHLAVLHLQESFCRAITLDVICHSYLATPVYAFSWKIPILAVNPWRKLLVPIGPISPLQKKPAMG